MIFNLLFLIPLFIIGGICSYTDIKYGKIKNRWIARGLIWGVILYFSLGFYSYFYLHQLENIHRLIEMTINGSIALTVGYFIWRFKLWTAGDAKLFALFAFLIPLEFYSKTYFPYFPSFALLINIFIPLFLILGIKTLIFHFKEGGKKIEEIKKRKKVFTSEKIKKIKPQIVNSIKTYIVFIFIFVLLQLARVKTAGLFTFISEPFLLFLFLFAIYRSLVSLIAKNKFISLGCSVAGGAYGVYLLINNQAELFFSVLRMAFIFMVLVGLSRQLLDSYIEKKEVQKIKIRELREGMFPSMQELVTKTNLPKDKFGSVEAEGLTKEHIELIKTSCIEKPNEEIKIYKTFAFAPFMLLGTLITVFTKNSFIAILLSIPHHLHSIML